MIIIFDYYIFYKCDLNPVFADFYLKLVRAGGFCKKKTDISEDVKRNV